MKDRYRLVRRGNRFYAVDRHTLARESLNTDDARTAERILAAKNESVRQTNLNLALGRTYLSAHDPAIVKRTWQSVMNEFCGRGKEQTIERRMRTMKGDAFVYLKGKRLVETTADDFRRALAMGGAAVNLTLRCMQNLALGLGWLPAAIIPSKLWPEPKTKSKRGITVEEHRCILQSEQNAERRSYYQLLWEIGAAQSDAATMSADNIDWQNRVLTYQRQKTGEWASIQIGTRLEELLRSLPREGLLFPHISRLTAAHRSSEFCRRCRVVKISGVSLHSYRYAWAQRARACGYPLRWAQNSLGHNSKAVHLAYARGVVAVCPSLEAYEGKRTAGEAAFEPRLLEIEAG
jgi:integrase